MNDNSVQYDQAREPFIVMNHVDGPMLVCHNGTFHWLTLYERFLLWIGATSVIQLDTIHSTRISER